MVWSFEMTKVCLLPSFNPGNFWRITPASDLPMGLFNFFLCPILLLSLPFRGISGNTPQMSMTLLGANLQSWSLFLREAEQGTLWEQESSLAYGCTWKEGLILSRRKMPLLGLSCSLAQPLPTQLESWTSSGSQCLEGLGTGLGKEENLAAKWLRRLQRRVYLW